MSEHPLAAPIARRGTHTFELHGQAFSDAYAWLHDKSDPAVIAYLEAENAYADAALRHTAPLQERLFHELRGRIEEDDSSAPLRSGDYFDYTRVEAGKQYRVFCRRRGALDAPEEVLLDENALAAGLDYCSVFAFEPSPDHNLLAYAVDTTGAWVFELYVKDLRTGELLAGPIAGTAWTLAWASDSRTLFYTTFDAAHRADTLMRHRVGETGGDARIYHEPDETFMITIARAHSGAYLLLTIGSHTSSEVRYLRAGEPTGALEVIEPRRPWVEYYAEHQPGPSQGEDGGRFLIRTNDAAENFKLLAAPVDMPGREGWREIIPHRADTLIQDVRAFRDHLVVFERQGGYRRIRLSAPDGVSNVRHVEFPEPVYTFDSEAPWGTSLAEFASDALRFQYSSLVTPDSTIDYDMAGGGWEVKKRQQIPSGYDPSRYRSERLSARAPDGREVPISLVYRADLRRPGGPLLLYGYGAYGRSMEPSFQAKHLSLLDRGFVYAIAHIRGGSELGRGWYEQGRLMFKQNTFTDFVTCAEHLIDQGYTTRAQLAIMGRSAGGLLMGAVLNMRPELFQAAVALVPFTNVITAMLMPDLPLTVTEYEEWGNPADPAAFEYMRAYSPYEQVAARDYPHIYAKGGLNDLQVPYWDPAKWVARLRAHKTDANRLVLVTEMGAGHMGTSGRFDHLHEDAQIYAFLIDALGAPVEPVE
jgi:oligopeptidase B